MNQRREIGLLVIMFAVIFSVVSLAAQPKKAGKGEEKKGKAESGFGFTTSRAPIDITSDTVEASQKESTVTFKGNVVAVQEDTTLNANMVIISYDPDTKKVKEIRAIGNVKVVQLDRRATGQRATFYQDENKIVLDGEAVVREGENVIRGERITFYVDEQKSLVEGGKGGRVSTTIIPPPREEEKDKPKDKEKERKPGQNR